MFIQDEQLVNVAPVVSVCPNLRSFPVLGAIWPLVPIVTLKAAGTNHKLRRWNGQSKAH